MTPSNSTADISARVGVVGPGLMGLGIAQAFAASGAAVVLCGRDEEASRRGRASLAASLSGQVARGRLDPDAKAAVLARVEAAGIACGLQRCDLVIESAPEDRAVKNALLAKVERAAPTAILASTTSGLAIGGLAQVLVDPSRFLGLHFFSPANRMPLVEVAIGPRTSDAVVRQALALVRGAGKRPIVVRDGPGFFATRVFAAYLDEAVAMATEGIGVETIDDAALANGRAVGPFATLDETGIALNLAQARQAREDGLEPRFCRPLAEATLERLVSAGRSGRRAGGGFYDWPSDGPRTPWAGLGALFPLATRQSQREDIQFRLLAAEAREALRCLEEGVVASADDADAASVLGLGFSHARGGVLRWAEDFGFGPLVEALDDLSRAHGDRFSPSPWLRALAARAEGLSPYRGKDVPA
ncbi:MAG: 3-hydroxyacyl-CoA dehydrogenase family protein [Hyphomicrobiales bacterium]|nr:3-hydroxyacyl-CoA dehydrogenase family protein [Hyphomicrobiales bacterium]MBV8441665.1 3-hydroxyacyl-CoA dehydrogenase family protein [Hyphomicrobiales bacterium]